ncbi:dTDP-4-dehydrorhamnose 3,5-epimerase [Litoribrevibacter euphylliae]|uniref:dTDP-4-dehydrorhamnose 3,5-epimerase n=1 Tax=Litoribrevibacter euphylliae TaxID=1834034 RepID=A0ABV7HFJ7_9GAMM
MKVIETELEGLKIIEPEVFGDDRGFFLETFQQERFNSLVAERVFVQDNHSFSTKNILRGIHLQKHLPQGKLVRVVEGEVFDVAVDLRPDSKTFGQWFGLVLSGENKKQMWLPEGFGHGFLVMSETAHFEYKCTSFYSPDDELCMAWNDPTVSIDWPIHSCPVLSEKDQKGVKLIDLKKTLLDL